MTRTLLMIAAATGVALAQTATGRRRCGRRQGEGRRVSAVPRSGRQRPDPSVSENRRPARGVTSFKALEDYKTGARQDPVMAAFSTALSKRDQQDLAAWYASQGGLYTIEFTE